MDLRLPNRQLHVFFIVILFQNYILSNRIFLLRAVGHSLSVLDPGKGVCADPADGGAILGKGEPDPHSRDRERQLAPDKGRGKT